MITSSPSRQLTGVARVCLAINSSESIAPQRLVEVPASRHEVDEDQLDLLVRAITNTLRPRARRLLAPDGAPDGVAEQEHAQRDVVALASEPASRSAL